MKFTAKIEFFTRVRTLPNLPYLLAVIIGKATEKESAGRQMTRIDLL